MLRVGLNGFGRIGRTIFRNIDHFEDVQIVAINDLNPEIQNVKYLLEFDSIHGRTHHKVSIKGSSLICDDNEIRVFCEKKVSDVPWANLGCDLVIEAAGAHALLEQLPDVISSGVSKVVVTHSPDNENIDNYIVLGANEESYNPVKHNIISSSICDSVAFTPIFKLFDENFGVESGFLTTLHPWLAYQNLLDGMPQSWGYPGSLYGHYSLGRASTETLILKPTTAVSASSKINSSINEKIKCYSYRVPTPVVGAADITFKLSSDVSKDDILEMFSAFIKNQKWPILFLNDSPLVSKDFAGTDYSSIVDARWLEVVGGSMVKVTSWYDNEWGYSRRVVDVSRFIFGLEPEMIVNEKNSLS